jgi:hypothetical protein
MADNTLQEQLRDWMQTRTTQAVPQQESALQRWLIQRRDMDQIRLAQNTELVPVRRHQQTQTL